MAELAAWLGIAPVVAQALALIYALLLAASVAVWAIGRARPGPLAAELGLRLRSWWVMIAVFSVAVAVSPGVSAVFLGFLSFLALKEYLSLIPTRRIDRAVLLWAYLAIPVQFWWAYTGWFGMFMVFIPVWMFLFLPMVMVILGQTAGFLRAVGTLSWGLMMTVFTLSHMALLLAMPNGAAGGAGLLLFLVLLAQFNDVAQFTWGKLTGRRPILPTVSPKKTWEGFLGGLVTTTALGALVGPWFTVMSPGFAALAAAAIAAAGFVGDVTISALKRDLGVKDTGSLIPGHGGILDRVDSLTYAAPVFLHLYHYFQVP